MTEAPVAGQEKRTRERILDVAQELFIEHGFDKTSLREIADRLGFTKAALYYHFASKEDILLALHMRLHDLGREALDALGQGDPSPRQWAALLDGLIDQMIEHRAVFILHERNQAALEKLHSEEHSAQHDDLQARLRAAVSNPRIALGDRIRMASAVGAVMGGLVLAGDAFADVPSDQLSRHLRAVVGDLLGPKRSARARTAAGS